MRLASPLSLALIAVLPLISAATFTTSTATLTKRGMYDDSPFNVANSGATPAYQPHPLPILLPMSSLSQHLGALQLFSSSPILSLPSLNATLLSKRMIRTARASKTCLDSTANDSIINTLLTNGGVGATLYLCPNAVILLNNSIIFGVQNQTLQTLGATGSDRATLRIISSSVSTAIVSTCDACSGTNLRDLIVDGSRSTLGWSSGNALIELGGNSKSVYVNNVAASNCRGWSTIHVIEGYQNSCTGASITNNQISDAGNSPNNGAQFRKRATPVYTPGQWADGISLSCANSVVLGNTITDATDGGIVIFGGPYSTIANNVITAVSRNLLGGINAVDYNPWSGNLAGVVVKNNTLNAQSAMIKVGLAIGVLAWELASSSTNKTTIRISGATYTNNVLTSVNNNGSPGIGYFGFGVGVSGADNTVVSKTTFVSANFGGSPTNVCPTGLPAAGPLYFDPYSTKGNQLQSSFVSNGSLSFLICTQEGLITTGGVNGDGTVTPLSSTAVNANANPSSTSSSSSTSSATSTTVSSTATTTKSTIFASPAKPTTTSTCTGLLCMFAAPAPANTTPSAPKPFLGLF